MRVNRSIQVEGAFGIIKQNMAYDRFRRTTINNVKTEFMLTCLGYNIRKLMRFMNGKTSFKYWYAPNDLTPEKFKKPSAKRLRSSMIKKQTNNNR